MRTATPDGSLLLLQHLSCVNHKGAAHHDLGLAAPRLGSSIIPVLQAAMKQLQGASVGSLLSGSESVGKLGKELWKLFFF